MFGHPYKKDICLWLKNLPVLLPTQIVEGRKKLDFWSDKRNPGGVSLKSKTFPGIAKAMAEQWSENLIISTDKSKDTEMTEKSGFYPKKERKPRAGTKDYSCSSCGLYKDCLSPRMLPYGNFKKGIMNIGEAPGEREDELNMPWQGRTGRLLESTYRKLGIDLFDDCINLNAVNCRPTDKHGNRPPTNFEIECCRRLVLKAINQYKPKVIVLLGNSAVYSIIGNRWKRDLGGITKWRGWMIPDQDLKAWVCPTFHPSFIEREDEPIAKVIWQQDLQKAIEHVPIALPEYPEPKIEIIKDLNILNSIKSDTIAIDFETTGIKPHAQGHEIISCAVADTPDHCFVFLMPKKRSELVPLLNMLTDKKIKKRAQNMKFEHSWAKERLRVEIKGWEWDSMLATHLLDNRPGITSLKFQTFVNFGVADYSSEIEPYLKTKDKDEGANAINMIKTLLELPNGTEKLLTYNAYDAIYEYRLSELQMPEIKLPF